MRILTVSDRVEPIFFDAVQRERFSNVDLVLSCGDLPPEYLSHLMHTLNAPLFYVRGNHDIRYGTSPPSGCEDLEGKLIRFGGLHIVGFEGSRWYNGGPIQYTEKQMQKRIRLLQMRILWRKRVDIVISHAPPRHVHDAEDPCHKGFRSFHKLIDRYAPAYFVHGHIHAVFTKPEQRVTIVRETRVVNTFGHHLIEVNIGKADRQAVSFSENFA